MANKNKQGEKPRLEVYLRKSVLVQDDGDTHQFDEGNPSTRSKVRLDKIKQELTKGFLTTIITACKKPGFSVDPIDEKHFALLTGLVDSVTSEVGRAIVGLTVLQFCVKSITPEQSIRLHKAGGGGRNFSWCEGIPMRVLDKNFITPILREHDLLKLNADGFMMTRSLAENYPYSKLYKAAIRGARREWLELVDLIEMGQINPLAALKNLIGMLINRSDSFKRAAEEAMKEVRGAAARITKVSDAVRFLRNFIDTAPYSARLFEVAMHSLFQVLEDAKVFGGSLKPLSQMRSANKKHGNVGDIEIVNRLGGLEILEAWDAKYGKLDLRDELEELNEKLEDHSETEVAGFVTDRTPTIKADAKSRMGELEMMHEVDIKILGFDEWVASQVERVGSKSIAVAALWICAFAECLCQKRRGRAPIDEPCDAWVDALAFYSKSWT